MCAYVYVGRAHAQVHTDVERWRQDRLRVFRFTIFRQLSFSFPFSRREREREGNIAGIFFIDGDLLLLLFSSSGVDLIFFFFSFQPSLKRRVISPGLKGRLKGVIFLMRTAN